jgi:hypothetical protein
MANGEGKRELQEQADIKKSVRLDGGYSFKLSNRFTIGIPDLLIALPPFVPILAEVKDLAEWGDVRPRKLDVSPKQEYELNGLGSLYDMFGRVSILLVALRRGRDHYLVGLPRDARVLLAPLPWDAPSVQKRQSKGYYPLAPILQDLGVPRLV